MKRTYKALAMAVLMAFILSVPAFANSMSRDVKEGVENAETKVEDAVEDAVTDIEGVMTDALDPENGAPEAEEDGIVDNDKGKDTSLDNKDDDRPGDTTNEQPSTDDERKDTTDNKANDTTDDKGVIEGMELEENGINPWAIVIAVIVVIAVLVLIFILIPRRRR